MRVLCGKGNPRLVAMTYLVNLSINPVFTRKKEGFLPGVYTVILSHVKQIHPDIAISSK